MSYDSTVCPCGGSKLRETMLCAPCETHVAGSFDRVRMDDLNAPWAQRRAAAIRVLAVARRRMEGKS